MTVPPRIRVLVVDDHLMVRDGLKVFLSAFDDIEVVGGAEDGEKAVAACGALKPDVVLMDLVMPGVDGAEATAIIRRRWPDTSVIALTSFAERDLVQRAIASGAVSYLLKDVHADKLAAAIRDAHKGRSTIDAEAARILVRGGARNPIGGDLTPREREVLVLLVAGRTNAEIARELSISVSTARLHVSNILGKLGAANRTEAAALAHRHGLV